MRRGAVGTASSVHASVPLISPPHRVCSFRLGRHRLSTSCSALTLLGLRSCTTCSLCAPAQCPVRTLVCMHTSNPPAAPRSPHSPGTVCVGWQRARSFNQPLNIDTSSVRTMNGMFQVLRCAIMPSTASPILHTVGPSMGPFVLALPPATYPSPPAHASLSLARERPRSISH